MNFSLIDLSEDIRDLYLKTGIKDIEENYISVLAASTNNVTDEEIIQWIKNLSGSKVSDSKVEKALKILPTINENDLINKWNAWLLENMRLPAHFTVPKKDFDYPLDYIGHYVIFGKLLGNENTGLLLRPFENILRFFSSPKVIEQIGGIQEPDQFTVFHDLMQLQNDFLKSRDKKETKDGKIPTEQLGNETKQEKLQNLYDDLYDWFSDDFAKAAHNLGYKGLAEQMEKGGLLGSIGALKEYVDNAGLSNDIYIAEPNQIYVNHLNDLIQFIMKPSNLNRYLKPENHLEAYREIKEYIMKMSGQVRMSDIAKVRRERDKNIRVPSRTKQTYNENFDPGPELPLSDDSWMSGVVMTLISTVLAELHYRFNL